MLPAIAAGAAAGGLALGYFGQREANTANSDMLNRSMFFNAEEAQKNRDFQERMANTAYGRATNDMRAAGINPMLAYMQGGASAPSGSTASAGVGAAQESTTAGISNSAVAATRIKAELENLQQNTEATRAQESKTISDTNLNNEKTLTQIEETLNKSKERELIEFQKAQTAQQTALARKNTEIAETNAKVQKAQLPANLKKAQIDGQLAPFDAVLDRVGTVLQGINSAKGIMTPIPAPALQKGQGIIDMKTGEVIKERK